MNRRWTIILIIFVFAALSIAASITSAGFLEADGCTHYLYARFALHEPHYLVNIWGRPFCTALYALPAAIAGRFGVRCASLLLAIAISLIALAIARQQKLREPVPTLALIFTLAQPLLFLHSFSELTELPFAFLLGGVFLLYLKRRWLAFAIVCSILPLARPEGFGFLILAALALVGRDRWWWIFILPISLIIWNRTGWIVYGSPGEYPWYMWLVRNWPYAEKSAYLSGSIWHFAMLMPAVISPLIFPALIVGIAMNIKKLIALIPLSILVGHSVLYATGRMASSGELRYMLIVAPFWAVLTAQGWDRFLHNRREISLACLAACAPIAANFFYRVVPLTFSEDWRRAKSAVAWANASDLRRDYPLVQAAHPGIAYFSDASFTDSSRFVEWRRDLVEHPRDGVIVIWDWVYALHNSDTLRIISEDDLRRAGWFHLDVPAIDSPMIDKTERWSVYLSPRDANHLPTRPVAPASQYFLSRPESDSR